MSTRIHGTTWLVLASLLAQLLVPAFALAGEGGEGGEGAEAEATQAMRAACLDSSHLRVAPASPEGPAHELKHHLYVLLAADSESSPRVFDCTAFGVGPVPAKKNPDFARATGEHPCFTASVSKDLAAIVNLKQAATQVSDVAACQQRGTELLSPACAKEVGCNGLRSMTTLLTGGTLKMGAAIYDHFRGESAASERGCMSLRKDDCVQSVVTGVLKDLWANIEGIGYLAKLTWDGAKWVGAQSWSGVKWAGGKVRSWFSSEDEQAAENRASEAALAAGRESESSIRQFLDHPAQFIQDYSVRLFNAVGDFIKEHFHAAWLQWKCASCDDVVNGVCSIAGMLGGEVLLAFLTGGALNAASKSAKLAKIGEVVGKVGEVVGKSRTARVLLRGAEGVSKVALYVPEKLLKLVAKLPGLKQYLHLTEKAFLQGYRHGIRQSVRSVFSRRAADEVIVLTEADIIHDADEVIEVSDADIIKEVDHARPAGTPPPIPRQAPPPIPADAPPLLVEDTPTKSLRGPPRIPGDAPRLADRPTQLIPGRAEQLASLPPPVVRPVTGQSAQAWGEDLARMAVLNGNRDYLTAQQFIDYNRAVDSYQGVSAVPQLEMRFESNGMVTINGGDAVISGHPVHYESVTIPSVKSDATAGQLLEKQYPGAKAEPLLDAAGKPVGGGFQSVYHTPPGHSALDGRPSLIKVADPSKIAHHVDEGSRALLSADRAVTKGILEAAQLDDAYFEFLAKLAKESGQPPAFELPLRKRLSPTVVEVEKLDAPTISQLRRENSPLLQKCRSQLERFARVIGTVYIGMDQAYRQRYGEGTKVRLVAGKGVDGTPRYLPAGPDLNGSNVKLTDDCRVQVIDQ